jgi:hypothetical protein
MSYGVDKSIVYIRKPEVFDNIKKYVFEPMTRYQNPFYLFIVGFCGELHIGLRPEKGINNLLDPKHFLYTIDDVKFWLESTYTRKELDKVNRYRKMTMYEDVLDDANKIFKHKIDKSMLNIFQEYKVPVFVWEEYLVNYSKHKLTLNPCLKDYKFYKVKNVAQAFQDIQMYISGVLGASTNPMINISNKDMIVKKGFDLKTSFRHPIKFKKEKK